MKLTKRILFSLLCSTMAFSAFGGSKVEYLNQAADWSVNNRKEIGTHVASFAAGALLMYLASNQKVKTLASRTSSAISNYTKAQYRAIANYWRSLSKRKKLAVGAAAAAAAAAAGAYVYFEGPGVNQAKDALGLDDSGSNS